MSLTENQQLLEERVHTSRLLGQQPSLVLHGGGNTSVKLEETNCVGENQEVLYVKGSGWDLATITAAGFSPVRAAHLRKLAALPSLTDSAMVNELVTHLTRASAPVPSVEAILHAIIPHRFVDHTHADAIVAISNSVNGEAILRELYGDKVVYIPYIMPGFDLSRLCASLLEQHLTPDKTGLILFNHGVFSFGATAAESYNRMLELVKVAEDYLQQQAAVPVADPQPVNRDAGLELAALRQAVSQEAGFPVILKRVTDPKTMAFCARADLGRISQQGPATPDHVIRTKRLPMVGRDVKAYAEAYRTYFAANEPTAKERKKILDPAPRVVLDPVLGLCAIGRTVKDAGIVADIYDHTIDIIQRAEALGGYRALPASDIFDVEYWELEQAKLAKGGAAPELTGTVALVTGAASGIGKASVESLLQRGAAVVGLDLNPAVEQLSASVSFLGIRCDISAEDAIRQAIAQGVEAFGGIDIVVLNAGIFPPGARIDSMTTDTWQRVMRINLDANFQLLRATHPYLRLAPQGGRVVIIGSKNVAAPGPGAAAYSASKAALNQLARVAALEWGRDNIRVNSVHPNAVFDTGIWTDDVLQARADHYGMTVDAYKKNNVLQTEVRSADVAEMAASLCGNLFGKTTGAQIPVDGGNDRVI